MTLPRILLCLATTLAALGWTASALAQPGLGLVPPGLDDEENGPEDPLGGDQSVFTGWELNEESVVFSASQKRQLTTEAPSTVHVVTDRQIRNYGWRTFADVLRMVPGVQTRTFLSQYQSVMIRGLLGTEVNNTRILWLENGLPTTNVRDAGVWLDDTYPVELIKRLEVVLGPGSALYGTGAMQGVINIFTKEPGDIPEYGEYRVGFGTANTLRTSALWGQQFDKLGVMIFASANITDGPGLITEAYYRQQLRVAGATAVRAGEQPLAPEYDVPPVSLSSSRSWQHIRAKVSIAPVRITVGFKNVDAGYDGAEFFPAQRYQFDHRELFANILYEQELVEDLSITALASYRFFQNLFTNYNDINLESIVRVDNGRPDPRYPDRLVDKITYTTDQHKAYVLAQLQWKIYEDNELIGGLNGRFEAIQAPEFRTDKVEQQFFNGSVFLQDEQRLLDDNLIITAGLRVDSHREFDTQLSYRAAILTRWGLDWLLTRVSYSTAFREPSMWQLYVDHVDALGTPDLTPETLQNIELSLIARFESYLLRLDGFVTLMDNLILNDFNTELAEPLLGISGKFNPRQTGNEARMFGFEASARGDITRELSFFAFYNFLISEAKLCSDCDFEDIEYDAPHRVGAGLAYNTDELLASLKVHFVSETLDRNNDGTETQTVPPYVLLQPQIRVRLPYDFGALLQGSYALSEGLGKAPTQNYYYETLAVPVPRFTFLLGLNYPYAD